MVHGTIGLDAVAADSNHQCIPIMSLQCFDTVGWATGRASGL